MRESSTCFTAPPFANASLTASTVTSPSKILSCAWGNSYRPPGRMGRSADIDRSTRRKASRIRPFSVSITLAHRPINSAIKQRVTASPISLVASNSSTAKRSCPICLTCLSLAPANALRSSIQKAGACGGLSGRVSVRCIRGADGSAHTSNRPEKDGPRNTNINSAGVG